MQFSNTVSFRKLGTVRTPRADNIKSYKSSEVKNAIDMKTLKHFRN